MKEVRIKQGRWQLGRAPDQTQRTRVRWCAARSRAPINNGSRI